MSAERLVRTTATAPGERGREFGKECAERVAASWEGYLAHFENGGLAGREEIEAWGAEALAAVDAWWPAAATEIEGIAAGSGLPAAALGAVNARTELLARVARRGRGECSVIVALDAELGRPRAAQTWDWHEEFADTWVVWGLADAESGMRLQTVTEAGMLAKLGVNSSGLAVLLNVLHHEDDASVGLGVPIHVLLRRVLTESETVFDAVRLLSAAPVAASSAVTLIAAEGGEDTALTAELRPGAAPGYVLPDDAGRLVHTNHFLSPAAVPGDREPTIGPDSLFRLEILRRRAARLAGSGEDELLEALGSHLGGGGAICCHPEPGAELGDRYGTLTTVVADPAGARLRFVAGGPCEALPDAWTEVSAVDIPTPKEETHVRPD